MPGHVRPRGKRRDGPKRKDGTRAEGSTIWQARWRHPADQRIRIERNFKTKRDGERWLAEQEASAHNGTYLDSRRAERPFSAVYEAWKASWDGRLQPQTTARYEQVWRAHLEPAFAKRKTNSITHETIQRFLDGLRDSGAKPGTVKKVHAVLSAAFTEAVRLGVVHTNPCRHVRLPRAERREMLFLSASKARKLAEAIHPHFRVLLYVAAYTGLRAGELFALRREDIDPLHGTLTVRRALKDGGEFGPTKTHKARRIKLPAFILTMLTEHLSSRPPGGDSLVFVTRQGAPIDRRVFYRRDYKPAVRAALPKELAALRFHDLRHTCAALLISRGAHLLAVKEQLGHSSITVTADCYGHLAPGLADSLADALDAAHAESVDNVVTLRVEG